MVSISLPDSLVRELEVIAEEEKRSVAEIIASMLRQYRPVTSASQEERDAAFERMIGIYDDDVTDMSTVHMRDIMAAYRREQDRRNDKK